MKSRVSYWKDHYRARHSQIETVGIAKSVEYSNERVQMQIYAHVLEGVGEASERSVLDVGCGWGNSTLMLHACGARVTGIDIVPETISTLRTRYPFVNWELIDVMDEPAMRSLPVYDCVVATEVLEHVPFEESMRTLWAHVAPGGRLVATVPNSECPILQRGLRQWGIQEFLSHISPGQIGHAAATLPGVGLCRLKGFTFREDQEFTPYEESDWAELVDGVPNRIVFVFTRQE
jgi:2-polyprenyl-3-methyl-5-hydroxy-6-metoxy-1,4-benzoquinol methylase